MEAGEQRTLVLLDNAVAGSGSGGGGAAGGGPVVVTDWSALLAAGCEIGRINADLFPQSRHLSFAITSPDFRALVDWVSTGARKGVGAAMGSGKVTQLLLPPPAEVVNSAQASTTKCAVIRLVATAAHSHLPSP